MPVLIPRASSTISRSDRAMSAYIAPEVVGKIYSIFLWDVEKGEVATSTEYDVTDQSTTLEHFFTVPPKSVSMSEPFATSIAPSQNGGIYTESHGSLIRLVNISGTTGVRPHKLGKGSQSAAALQSSDGQASSEILPFDYSLGLNPNEITGHDSAINLRNLFRTYSDRQVEGNTSIVMVYRNVKDDDHWIVEPTDFKLSQEASSPFSYTYTISLKTLARFDKTLLTAITNYTTGGTDPQENREGVMGMAARMRARQQTLTYSYYITLANNNIFKGGGITAANNILKPLSDTIKGLEQVSRGVYGTSDMLLQNTEKLAYQLKENLTKLEDLKDSPSVRTTRRHWRRSLIASYGILNEPQYRTTSQILIQRRSRIERAYQTPGLYGQPPILPNTGGSPSFLTNNPVTTNVAQAVVGITDDLRTIAQRLLGDSRRWQELAVLNQLKPPYVNNIGGPGVLGPGDTILYPAPRNTKIRGVRLQDNPDQNYDNLGTSSGSELLDQTYGRDLRLKSNVDPSGFGLTDLDVNQRGDISTIVGVDNVQQAIRIKFATEKGTLPVHPYFGARFAIGSKADTNSFNTFRLNTLTTLLSDDRVQEVKKLNFSTVGDTLSISADLLLVNDKDYINTHFAMRKF